MFRKFRVLFILLGSLLLLMNATLQAQTGRGVIVLPVGSPESLLELQPLRCDDSRCDLLNSMLLPTLQAVDIPTGRYVPAGEGNHGLTESIDLMDDQTAVFALRDDLMWSDGTPITAYDVYYSFLVALPPYLRGAVPLDDQHIAFLYNRTDCAVLDATQFPIVPVRSDSIQEFIINYFDEQTDDDLLTQSDAWFARRNYSRPTVTYQLLLDRGRTAGAYRFDELRPLESLRLVSIDGEQAVRFETLPANRSRVQAFVEGDFTVLDNVPLDERLNLLNTEGVQTYSYPSDDGYYLRFNFADPFEPQSAFSQFGEELDQGVNGVTADPAVRQAIRVGLDINAIIDRAVDGFGTPINGTQSPYSWARNPDLPEITYDVGLARRILEDAGWRDTNRDGIRECIRCAMGEVDRSLSFSLYVPGDNIGNTVGVEIARQLLQIGIGVNTYQVDGNDMQRTTRFQDFDAYLTTADWQFPAQPDRSDAFTRTEDILGSGANDISYVNPQLESLLIDARTLDGCDVDERAALYRQAEQIIATDLPEIWLFAPDNMIAVQDEVLNFAPIGNLPLWNMDDWVIVDSEVQG